MWIDIYAPGCLYDEVDCNGNCCEEGKAMYEEYLKSREETDISEAMYTGKKPYEETIVWSATVS